MSNQTNTQKVLKGVSTQAFISLMMGVIEIVSFSILSRLLTQRDFGYYAAISAVTSVFSVFSDAGIGSAIVQRKNLDKKFIDNAFTISLVFGIVGTSLMLILSRPLSYYVADDTMMIPLMLVALTLLMGSLSSVNYSIMHRKLQFFQMGIIRISALILTTIVSIILAFKGFGYYAIISKVILYSIIQLFASYLAANTLYHLSFDKKVFKEIFSFSGWLQASVFFREIANQIDKLMMSSLFNVTTLGLYSRPKEFINSMTGRLTGIFDSSLFPVLSSIQDEKERIKNTYTSTLYYLNIVGLMITLSFMFNSELIIRIFLGVDWMNVNTLFIVLSISGICLINGSLGDIFLRSLAFTKQQFYLRILQTILSIVMIITAARFGLLTVAIAYLLANSVVVISKMGFISNKIDFGLKESLLLIIKSYQVAVVYVPVYILCMIFMPNTIGYNILKLILFCLITICTFVFFPNIVGYKYKTEMHYKVVKRVKQYLSKN